MRKLLVLLTLVVGLLVFSASAFAQCSSCKDTLRHVQCKTGQTATCGPFDYDRNASPADGYCSYTVTKPYLGIFHICDCDDTDYFKAGNTLDLRMTLLVNGAEGENGAYWGAPTVAANLFDIWDDDPCATGAGILLAAESFGAPTFYRGDKTSTVAAAALDTGVDCAVTATSRAVILNADNGALGYTLPTVPAGVTYDWWVIDIPPVVLDLAQVTKDDVISVRIDLVQHGSGGYCSSCEVKCSCTIDLAQVCCTEVTTTDLVFPYFTSLINEPDDDWWNGISIMNPTAAAGSCDLTAYEKDGDIATVTVSVPAYGMFEAMLDDTTLLPWTTTGTLGGSACFIKAECNYVGAQGFGFMATAEHDSMGYIVK